MRNIGATSLLLVLCTSACNAEEILIFGNEYKPPKIFSDNEKPKGILVDILKAISLESALTLELKLLPWNRAYREAKAGRGAIIGLSKTKQRLNIFDYSDVVYYDELFLLGTKNNKFTFNKISDLTGKTIGIQRGSKYGDEFEKAVNRNFTIEEDSNAVHRLKKLLRNRIDVAIVSGPGMAGALSIINSDSELRSRKSEFYLFKTPFKKDPNFLGVSKSLKQHDFMAKFNLALQRLKNKGIIHKIIQDWM
jgi:polar amino acid transport system substrate-binding protein